VQIAGREEGRLFDMIRNKGVEVETGRFQAHMKVHLVNDGPVTLLLDSQKRF
jgi:D-tyrosyl-tRNA(Tyr) deacylase